VRKPTASESSEYESKYKMEPVVVWA